ncbi:MAG: Gfo/Idh/MocA family oxidoreductase [Candidatus Limiplasma sp.]|nr:Gfo/Idh/MocA family oxidoreductase [Candidatus Limiplasma sp.]
MTQKADGQNYAPKGKAAPVCGPGEFPVGVVGLDHGHIYGMCNGLCEAGAVIARVYDPDGEKVEAFCKVFPQARAAQSREEVLGDPAIRLIASASIPSERAELGLCALDHGKDFFSDKPPCVTQEEVERIRRRTAQTGRKYLVYYSERLHVEGAVYAEQLISQGAIGRVVQVMGWGPHRASVETRPPWFFDPARYGGILVDIGCHQLEQILAYAGAQDAQISLSRVANYNNPQHPEFEDFGDVTLVCDNGVAGYCRLDWFTPDGLGAWGDGRTLIVGTEGYIEIRKYIDIAHSQEGDHVYLVNREGERMIRAAGQCGFPFFGRLIRDCLDRTETAMTQAHALRAIELAIQAQNMAQRLVTDRREGNARRE